MQLVQFATIEAEKTHFDKAEALVDYLPSCGERAFQSLLDSCDKRCAHVAVVKTSLKISVVNADIG